MFELSKPISSLCLSEQSYAQHDVGPLDTSTSESLQSACSSHTSQRSGSDEFYDAVSYLSVSARPPAMESVSAKADEDNQLDFTAELQLNADKADTHLSVDSPNCSNTTFTKDYPLHSKCTSDELLDRPPRLSIDGAKLRSHKRNSLVEAYESDPWVSPLPRPAAWTKISRKPRPASSIFDTYGTSQPASSTNFYDYPTYSSCCGNEDYGSYGLRGPRRPLLPSNQLNGNTFGRHKEDGLSLSANSNIKSIWERDPFSGKRTIDVTFRKNKSLSRLSFTKRWSFARTKSEKDSSSIGGHPRYPDPEPTCNRPKRPNSCYEFASDPELDFNLFPSSLHRHSIEPIAEDPASSAASAAGSESRRIKLGQHSSLTSLLTLLSTDTKTSNTSLSMSSDSASAKKPLDPSIAAKIRRYLTMGHLPRPANQQGLAQSANDLSTTSRDLINGPISLSNQQRARLTAKTSFKTPATCRTRNDLNAHDEDHLGFRMDGVGSGSGEMGTSKPGGPNRCIYSSSTLNNRIFSNSKSRAKATCISMTPRSLPNTPRCKLANQQSGDSPMATCGSTDRGKSKDLETQDDEAPLRLLVPPPSATLPSQHSFVSQYKLEPDASTPNAAGDRPDGGFQDHLEHQHKSGRSCMSKSIHSQTDNERGSQEPRKNAELNLPPRLMKPRQSCSEEVDEPSHSGFCPDEPTFSGRMRRCVSQPLHVSQALMAPPPGGEDRDNDFYDSPSDLYGGTRKYNNKRIILASSKQGNISLMTHLPVDDGIFVDDEDDDDDDDEDDDNDIEDDLREGSDVLTTGADVKPRKGARGSYKRSTPGSYGHGYGGRVGSNHKESSNRSMDFNGHQCNSGGPAIVQRDSRSSTCSTGSSLTSQSSYASDGKEFHCDGFPLPSAPHMLAAAIWDHISLQPEDLTFSQGDVIELIDWSPRSEVWYGARAGMFGWFPSAYVKLLVDHQSSHQLSGAPPIKSPSSSISASLRSEPGHSSWPDSGIATSAGDSSPTTDGSSIHDLRPPQTVKWSETRKNVLREILTTERDYVKLLDNLVEGFLHQSRRRPDMFTPEQLSIIFSNLEDIFALHKKFLACLEAEIGTNCDDCHHATVGKCFLRYQDSFNMYSTYCNNHALSTNELSKLYQLPKYHQFFEACRLLRDMMELTLDGFLLSPVQRICKYPLQLGELIKWTPPTHPDYHALLAAMHGMKQVAVRINDRKRRLDSLQKLLLWQRAVLQWQGPGILDSSSCLMHSGEVAVRFLHGNTGWLKDVCMYLFDHLLIFCKRDLLKRTQLVMRDRICTDLTKVSSVADGKDTEFNVAVKHGLKVRASSAVNFCYLIICKSRKQKMAWMDAFRRERLLVAEPQCTVPTDEEKRIAVSILRCQMAKPQPGDSGTGGKPDLLKQCDHNAIKTRPRPPSLTRHKTWGIFNVKRSVKP